MYILGSKRYVPLSSHLIGKYPVTCVRPLCPVPPFSCVLPHRYRSSPPGVKLFLHCCSMQHTTMVEGLSGRKVHEGLKAPDQALLVLIDEDNHEKKLGHCWKYAIARHLSLHLKVFNSLKFFPLSEAFGPGGIGAPGILNAARI